MAASENELLDDSKHKSSLKIIKERWHSPLKAFILPIFGIITAFVGPSLLAWLLLCLLIG